MLCQSLRNFRQGLASIGAAAAAAKKSESFEWLAHHLHRCDCAEDSEALYLNGSPNREVSHAARTKWDRAVRRNALPLLQCDRKTQSPRLSVQLTKGK
jgi:hypothetical protein